MKHGIFIANKSIVLWWNSINRMWMGFIRNESYYRMGSPVTKNYWCYVYNMWLVDVSLDLHAYIVQVKIEHYLKKEILDKIRVQKGKNEIYIIAKTKKT